MDAHSKPPPVVAACTKSSVLGLSCASPSPMCACTAPARVRIEAAASAVRRRQEHLGFDHRTPTVPRGILAALLAQKAAASACVVDARFRA
jgi:hypothetical protein